MRAPLVLLSLATLTTGNLQAQAPTGLAASVLANRSLSWITRSIPGFRVYFLAGSYPANHQDSLLARLPPALKHARALIHAPVLRGPIDLFLVESRAQMTAAAGVRATGFAEPTSRTVILVTNPGWRAFERHEIMHVVVGESWGAPPVDGAWLQEGIAQAADGQCGGLANADVAIALARRHGMVPFVTMLARFREQPDVRAYLQAAAFVDYLLRTYGARPVETIWRSAATAGARIGGKPLAEVEAQWRAQLHPGTEVPAAVLDAIESHGCG